MQEDEYLPADIILLKTSDAKGSCYVETKGLDGETNLKVKKVQKLIKEIKREISEEHRFYKAYCI